jgi:2-oxo-4-hydroxy-4-carboxy-5-ureidoimidazoline decarboxylase
MTLHELNTMPVEDRIAALLKCCGSTMWVQKMLPFFPADDMVELLEDAEEQWFLCTPADWKEAFAQHPKIGDTGSLTTRFATTAGWAANEQKAVQYADEETIRALAAANHEYEKKFGYIFIVCATGKNATEMIELLNNRLKNNPAEEIENAADEQNKITKLRIEKLLE